MRHINIAILTREHPLELLFRRSALLLSVALLFCYAYLAGISVFHAVVQRSTEAKAESVRTSLAELESEYFTLSRAVDPSEGNAIGLSRVSQKNFVERTIMVGQAETQGGLR